MDPRAYKVMKKHLLYGYGFISIIGAVTLILRELGVGAETGLFIITAIPMSIALCVFIIKELRR